MTLSQRGPGLLEQPPAEFPPLAHGTDIVASAAVAAAGSDGQEV